MLCLLVLAKTHEQHECMILCDTYIGLKCASCVSPICLLRWVEWVTFIHGVSRVCHAYMGTDLWLRAVSSCSQYKCCAIHCLTPGNQVNAVLHATHSNPAICPAQVLTVNQTGYYNQLLHVRRTVIDIFILLMLWILVCFSWEPITVFVWMTWQLALVASLLSCIYILSSSCRKIQWHMYNMGSCLVQKVLCCQEHMLTGCNSHVGSNDITVLLLMWKAHYLLSREYTCSRHHVWLTSMTRKLYFPLDCISQ